MPIMMMMRQMQGGPMGGAPFMPQPGPGVPPFMNFGSLPPQRFGGQSQGPAPQGGNMG